MRDLNNDLQEVAPYIFSYDGKAKEAWKLIETNRIVLVNDETKENIINFTDFKRILANKNVSLNTGLTTKLNKLQKYLECLEKAGVHHETQKCDQSNVQNLINTTITQPTSNQINYKDVPEEDRAIIASFLSAVKPTISEQPDLKNQIFQALSTASTNTEEATNIIYKNIKYSLKTFFSLENEVSKQYLTQQVGRM